MIQTYECPGCGAAMQFDSEKQKMVCDHCGTSCTVEELEDIRTHDVEREDEVSGAFSEPEQNGEFKVYKCPSCGGQIKRCFYAVESYSIQDKQRTGKRTISCMGEKRYSHTI